MAKKYEEEFKLKIVGLNNSGKSVKDIMDEYEISRSTVNNWIKKYGSKVEEDKVIKVTTPTKVKSNEPIVRQPQFDQETRCKLYEPYRMAKDEGDFKKAIICLENIFETLPEPKFLHPESYHVIDSILDTAIKSNDSETMKKWCDLILQADPERIDCGAKEAIVGRVSMYLGDEERAYEFLKIAVKKGSTRCFPPDKKLKEFYANAKKQDKPQSKATKSTKSKTSAKASKIKSHLNKPYAKRYFVDNNDYSRKMILSFGRWLIEDKVKNDYDLASYIIDDEDIGDIYGLYVGDWNDDYCGSQDIIDSLILNAKEFKALKLLSIGDFSGDHYYVYQIVGANYNNLWGAFEDLEKLFIKGTDGLTLGDVKHNNLTVLTIKSAGLSSNVFKEISNAELPSLEDLEVYIGCEEYGYNLTLEELSTFINSLTRFEKLENLCIGNAETPTDVIKLIINSPILKQLKTLNFSKGILYDDSAQMILDNIEKFNHLNMILLTQNYFSKEMLEKLKSSNIQIYTTETFKPNVGNDTPYYQ